MSYMRGEWYIYPSDGGLQIEGPGGRLTLPDEIAVDLAAMIWHRQTPEQQQVVLQRVADNYDGNFGADGVMKALGRQSVMDLVAQDLLDHPQGHPCRDCDRVQAEHREGDCCRGWC